MEGNITHTGIINRLFELLQEGTKDDMESYLPYFNFLEAHFKELSFLKSGCQLAPGLFEMEGEQTVYHQTAASVASLVCALVCAMDRTKMEAAMQILSVTKPEAKEAFSAGVSVWTMWRVDIPLEERGWLMMVMTVLNRLEKSFEVNKQVQKWRDSNDANKMAIGNHFNVLRTVLAHKEMYDVLAPSFAAMSNEDRDAIITLFTSPFLVSQINQGEVAPMSLKCGPELKKTLADNSLHQYLFHFMFQALGGSATKTCFPTVFVPPLAQSCQGLIENLKRMIGEAVNLNEGDDCGRLDIAKCYYDPRMCYRMYYECLIVPFEKRSLNSDPRLKERFKSLPSQCQLPVMRIMAMSRYLYKNLDHLMKVIPNFGDLIDELNGVGVRNDIMMIYGPEMVQTWLGRDLEDIKGETMTELLGALTLLYNRARLSVSKTTMLKMGAAGDHGAMEPDTFELNVKPVMFEIDARGENWSKNTMGELVNLLGRTKVHVMNSNCTQGLVTFNPMRLSDLEDLKAIQSNLTQLLAAQKTDHRKILNCSFVLRQSLSMKGDTEMQLVEELVQKDIAVWMPMLDILGRKDAPAVVKRNAVDVLTVLSFCDIGRSKLKQVDAMSVLKELTKREGTTLPTVLEEQEEEVEAQAKEVESADTPKIFERSNSANSTSSNASSGQKGRNNLESELQTNAKNLLRKLDASAGVPEAEHWICREDRHVMLSYSWGSQNPDGTFFYQEYMKMLCDYLKSNGVKVWMDINDMGANIVDSMSEAVDGSYLVICGFSARYAASANCRMELEYAKNQNKPIEYIKMEQSFKPTGWLGMHMGAALYHNFWNQEEIDKSAENILNKVKAMQDQELNRPTTAPQNSDSLEKSLPQGASTAITHNTKPPKSGSLAIQSHSVEANEALVKSMDALTAASASLQKSSEQMHAFMSSMQAQGPQQGSGVCVIV